jgi:type IV secretory pathway TraG/TraD family ATPase VirD4
MIRSIATAVENESADQISGVISSLQVVLAKINSPEMCYVLSGDDFSLDLNDPDNPKYLCIGTSPTLVDTFSPVVSCICTVALKLMNQQGKRHSYIMLDEGPTLYIPKLDVVPATARSNKVATIYMAQDFSQMKKEYGQNQAEAIVSNLNNQFFGRVASLQTAEYVSKIFGREDRLMTNESNNYSKPNSIGFDLSQRTHAGSTSAGISYSLQERQLIKPQEVLNLEVGQFVGTTVETDSPNFSAYIERDKIAIPEQLKNGIPDFASNIDVTSNYMRIILEVKAILNGKLQPEVPFASYID